MHLVFLTRSFFIEDMSSVHFNQDFSILVDGKLWEIQRQMHSLVGDKDTL